jgi:raffinose/stachyose/melibiose transport system permease protein
VLGTGVMLYSAGLSAIPKEQIEAAVVDGAGWWHLVWFIYRPALRPVTRFYVLLLTVTTVTGFFPWIFGLSQGGPGIASTTLDYDVYTAGITGGVWGRASAIAVFSVLLLIVLVLLQVAASKLVAHRRERAARRPARGAGLSALLGGRRPATPRRARMGPAAVLNVRRAVACLALFAIAFPILWVVRLAFKPPEQYIGAPGSFGGGWTLSNFSDAWTVGHLGSGLLNSLLIVPLGAAIATAVGAMAAFALAKLRLPFAKAILALIVLLVAIPLTAIAIPLFDQGLSVGYTDSRLGLSIVYGGLFASWGTLFMYSYFQGLPDELIDSARVDGASPLQTFLRIGLPLGAPAIASVFVIDILVQWNELIVALVSLPDETKQTVTVAIATFSTQFRSGGPLTAAGVLIAALPVIVVYFIGQRFIRAETLGGAVKG